LPESDPERCRDRREKKRDDDGSDVHARIVTIMDVPVAVDGRGMVAFPLEAWIAIMVIAAAAVLAILGAAARTRKEQCRLHDLKVRVHELRSAYQRRLVELRRGGELPVIEAVPVDEVGEPEPVRLAA
jgi:hypothetical protein